MTWDYARREILAALQAAKGNGARAQTLVAQAALKDQRLLAELAGPHLKGIVAHAVGRVIHEQTAPAEEHSDTPESLDLPLDAFGRELLGALKGRNTPKFAQEDAAPRQPKKSASKAHIDAINRIAKKT